MGEGRDNKRKLRDYLDMQVEEKRRMNEFEKNLDNEQARIWKMDTDKFETTERDINHKVNKIIFFLFFYFQVRALNYINSQFLKTQIDKKKMNEKTAKMNDEEYAINEDILARIKSVNNDFGRSDSFTTKFK